MLKKDILKYQLIKTEKLEDQFLARQRFFDIFASLTNPPKRFELPKI